MLPHPALNRFIACIALLLAGGCSTPGSSGPTNPRLQAMQLDDPAQPIVLDHPPALQAAGNEWTAVPLQITGLRPADGRTRMALRISSLSGEDSSQAIAARQFTAYQILPMPVDVNQAAYVRHTGQPAAAAALPRVLLPLPGDGGVIDLSPARDPSRPLDPSSRAGDSAAPLLLWIDLHVLPDTEPGAYRGIVELVQIDRARPQNARPLASIPLHVTVHDFTLPDERNLLLVGQLDWDDLVRLYPERFEAVTPRLLNRSRGRYQPAVETLDNLVALAQQHRVQLVIPRLQPTVKWIAGRPPQIDWADIVSVISPWMSGEAFDDGVPLSFWPIPVVDFLDRYDPQSRLDYWTAAAGYFDQMDWLIRAPVSIGHGRPGRAGTAESLRVSAEAAPVLAAHPRLRVMVPLEEDQVHLGGAANPNLVDPYASGRLLTAAPGLVGMPPVRSWPDEATPPQRWLRTDLPGLVPYAGAGERNVRLWAWLAAARQARLVLWDSPVPAADDPQTPADPGHLVWFYPGEWFGLDHSLPTLQLKWLRRAQQEYEYLRLARRRNRERDVMMLARLITRPLELQPHQAADPVYGLLSGTTDAAVWNRVHQILLELIASDPAQEDTASPLLDLDTLQWLQSQEHPLLLARGVGWFQGTLQQHRPGNWIDVRIGLDIYTPTDNPPTLSSLEWTDVPAGWEVRPHPVTVRSLGWYGLQHIVLNTRFDLDQVNPHDHRPLELTFFHGETRRSNRLAVMLPVSASDRREGRIAIDAALDEWGDADLIQDGPLVRMLDRPAVQRQELDHADRPAQVYTSWAEGHFYLAFRLGGVETAPQGRFMRNFVRYDLGRAWGEDLAQVLIQPVYEDNSLGPLLHLVCKPTGHWVERKLDPRTHLEPWQPLEGAGIRYASIVDEDEWTGEVAIPWRVINDPQRGRPTLLRFNFIQHRHATGESASWAGPVDFGRDESFMGLLHLREIESPGERMAR